MQIEFELDMNDWMELQKCHHQNSKQFQRTKLIVTLIMPIVCSVFLTIDAINGKLGWLNIVVFGILSLLWVVFYPKRFVNRTIEKTKKTLDEGDNSGLLGKHKIILNDEGLHCTLPLSEQKIQWAGIKKVIETNDYLFLYVTSVSAIIIPKKKIEKDVVELSKMLKANVK